MDDFQKKREKPLSSGAIFGRLDLHRYMLEKFPTETGKLRV